MKARYIRVSSSTQNAARQIEKQLPDEKLFLDVCSGSIPFNEREQGKALLAAIERKEINYLTVSSADRLGRNAFDIQSTLNDLAIKNVTVKIENLQGLESIVNGKPNTVFKMISDLLLNVAEMERESILERQREGIAIAKAQGKFKGRVKGSGMTDDEVLAKYPTVVKELKLGVNSVRKIAKLCEVGQDTVMKVKKIVDSKINKQS